MRSLPSREHVSSAATISRCQCYVIDRCERVCSLCLYIYISDRSVLYHLIYLASIIYIFL